MDIDVVCEAGVHCGACRDREGQRKWRLSLAEAYVVPAGWPDCECPRGKPWGYRPAERPAMQLAPQATGPAVDTVGWDKLGHALGLPDIAPMEEVLRELAERRLEICERCEHLCRSPLARHPVCAMQSIGVDDCWRPCHFRQLVRSPSGCCPDPAGNRWISIGVQAALKGSSMTA